MKTKIILLVFVLSLFQVSPNHAQSVGVGTSEPHSKLHIATYSGDNLMLENLNTLAAGSNNGIYFTSTVNSESTHKYTGAIRVIGTGTNAARMGLFTYTSNDPSNLSENLTIADNGNVGVGKTNPQATLDVDGTGSFAGDLTVNNGKGIMRSVNSTQLKCYSRDAGFAVTLGAFGSTDSNIGFTTGLFTSPPRVFVGDVVSGTGDFHKLRIVVFDVTPNNCKVRLYNESNTTITVDAEWSIICFGN